MNKLLANSTLLGYQNFVKDIYGMPNDRMFSLPDLLSNQERFTMRALKGVRKGEREKIISNLLISMSWLMTIANRLHIDVDEALWKRFPDSCSYCGAKPCVCGHKKVKKRKTRKNTENPSHNIYEYQKMFRELYPPEKRTLFEAGVHLAEEVGEISEVVCWFLGEHRPELFDKIKDEIADCLSCIFGLANSANIEIAKELAKMYNNKCHICHKSPCACNFSFIAKFSS